MLFTKYCWSRFTTNLTSNFLLSYTKVKILSLEMGNSPLCCSCWIELLFVTIDNLCPSTDPGQTFDFYKSYFTKLYLAKKCLLGPLIETFFLFVQYIWLCVVECLWAQWDSVAQRGSALACGNGSCGLDLQARYHKTWATNAEIQLPFTQNATTPHTTM